MIYSVYGLYIQSNAPIPGLVPESFAPRIDIHIWLQRRPIGEENDMQPVLEDWYMVQGRDPENPLIVIKKDSNSDCFYLLYSDGTKFVIKGNGSSIWASWNDSRTIEDTSTYLLGPVLGFILRLRGVTCLHASAVVVNGQAIVLLGRAGAGKSTTAAAFANLGYSVMSEDVVALSYDGSEYRVQPGYPIIRLWPESVLNLFGSNDALPLLTPNWDKRYLDLMSGIHKFQTEPLRLTAIYYLDERTDIDEAPLIETMEIRESLLTLISNTYANYLLDSEMRASEFVEIGRLASTTNIKRLVPHTDPARLNLLCRTIIDDYCRL